MFLSRFRILVSVTISGSLSSLALPVFSSPVFGQVDDVSVNRGLFDESYTQGSELGEISSDTEGVELRSGKHEDRHDLRPALGNAAHGAQAEQLTTPNGNSIDTGLAINPLRAPIGNFDEDSLRRLHRSSHVLDLNTPGRHKTASEIQKHAASIIEQVRQMKPPSGPKRTAQNPSTVEFTRAPYNEKTTLELRQKIAALRRKVEN